MDRVFVRVDLSLLVFLVISTLTSALVCPKKSGSDPTDVTGRLQALVKASNVYEHQDTANKYFYRWRVCASSDIDDDAIIQSGGKLKAPAALGRHKNARLVGGTDWFFITYPNGDKYTSHCNKAFRKSSVMVTCDPDAVKGTFKILEEYRDSNDTSTDECYYLFELNHKAACTVKPPDNSLSPGSILLIIVIIVASVYLILGFLYQRFVAGAKGLEQIPHYNFWISFGSLQADGCDFFCRCKKKKRSPAYKPVEDALSDDPHHEIPETDDENLLPAV